MAQRLVSFGTDGTVFNRGTPRHPAKLPVPATPAALPLLVMEGIRKEGRRGEGQALAWFDLQVMRGEMVTLLGPAGAGKSVALDLVAGFLEPDGGRLLIKGEKQAGVPTWRRDIGLVSGAPDLFPEMTVLGNAAFALEARGMARAEREERAGAMLERLGVPPSLAAERPGGLPLPIAMRVALARALVHEPALLLLDDPLGALAGEEREALAADLARLHRALGLTVLHATRDAALALSLSDRVAVLEGGTLRQAGTPRDLYERPADPLVAALTGLCNRLGGRVVSMEDGLCRVRLDCGPTVDGLPVTGPEGSPRPGGRCLLVIRPEAVAVAPLSAEEMGEDALPARLVENRFAGGHLRLRLEIGEGGELLAHRPPDLALPAVGEDAALAWALAAARVYPA